MNHRSATPGWGSVGGRTGWHPPRTAVRLEIARFFLSDKRHGLRRLLRLQKAFVALREPHKEVRARGLIPAGTRYQPEPRALGKGDSGDCLSQGSLDSHTSHPAKKNCTSRAKLGKN